MNYKEAISWLDGFQQFGVKLGLKRIANLCNQLGKPQKNYRIIHVGGTNGKGSVCRFIGSVLTKGGYKTGVYTSPHLQRFTERFIIDDKEISEKDVVGLVEKIKPIVEDMKKDGESPTYFEIVTAMAFLYFSEQKVDFAIIEVGLGGRFDATNIVDPTISVITNVTLEHQDVLGDGIGDIAFEKAGIIKQDVPVITGAEGDALKIIENKAREDSSELIIVDDTFHNRINFDIDYQEFQVRGVLKEYIIKTKMLGEFQGKNIALALNAVEFLQMNGVFLTEENILDGFGKAKYPGRMEIVQNNPIILLDGAHNIKGIEVLKQSLENDFEFDRLIFVVGILKDKKIEEMLRDLSSIASVFITTKSNNARACDPEKLKEILEKIGFQREIIVKNNISDAVDYAKSIAEKNDLICVTGSLFTVGETK